MGATKARMGERLASLPAAKLHIVPIPELQRPLSSVVGACDASSSRPTYGTGCGPARLDEAGSIQWRSHQAQRSGFGLRLPATRSSARGPECKAFGHCVARPRNLGKIVCHMSPPDTRLWWMLCRMTCVAGRTAFAFAHHECNRGGIRIKIWFKRSFRECSSPS